MGDYTVSGFYSRVPIRNHDKAIAIICHDNLETYPCNTPTYLHGTLIPYCLPIYGEMGDYGRLEYVEESVTTKCLEKLTGLDIINLLDKLAGVSRWKSDDEKYKDLFGKLDSDPIVEIALRDKGHRYYVIYEHESIYNKIASEIDFKNEYTDQYFKILKGHELSFNIFHDNLASTLIELKKWRKEINKLTEKSFENKERYKVHELMSNYLEAADMILYDKVKYALDDDMTNEIYKWCQFLLIFDFYCHGSFVFSSYSGQDWHHDKEYKEFRNELFDEFKQLLSRKYEWEHEEE